MWWYHRRYRHVDRMSIVDISNDGSPSERLRTESRQKSSGGTKFGSMSTGQTNDNVLAVLQFEHLDLSDRHHHRRDLTAKLGKQHARLSVPVLRSPSTVEVVSSTNERMDADHNHISNVHLNTNQWLTDDRNQLDEHQPQCDPMTCSGATDALSIDARERTCASSMCDALSIDDYHRESMYECSKGYADRPDSRVSRVESILNREISMREDRVATLSTTRRV